MKIGDRVRYVSWGCEYTGTVTDVGHGIVFIRPDHWRQVSGLEGRTTWKHMESVEVTP